MTQFLLRHRRRALSTDQLWLVVVLSAALFLTSLVPLIPNDFWWHLRIGEIIYETGNIPSTNMFAWTMPGDQPFVYGAWLAEYLLYTTYHFGGLSLTTFSRTLLWGIALYLVACEAHRRTRSWRLSALAVGVTALMTINNLIIRPQNWSWVPFVAYVGLLSRYLDHQLDRRWLFLCPLIMIFWANAHGAFVLGIVLLAIYGGAAVALTLLRPTEGVSWQQVLWLAVIGVLTVLAIVINPRGFGIIAYVGDLMTDQPSQQLVVEWQSPTPAGLPGIVFYISVLALLLLLWFKRQSPKFADALLIAAFLWLAWSGVRYVVWYALVATPIMVDLLAGLLGQRKGWRPQKNVLNVILVVLVALPVILVQPWFFERADWPFPEKYYEMIWTGVDQGSFIASETPVSAADYLRAHPSRHMYNEMGYGSYFIWALPEQKVFADPRVELYDYEQWLNYLRISNGVRYNAILAEYDVDRIVLDAELLEELLVALEDDPLWTRVYADARTQIWDRVSGND